MKSSAKNHQHLFEDQNFEENTNPFQRGASAPMQKAGKRPRIMKPLYSVRLS